ncbi:glycosyl hydrolase [Chthoniobacter flavus Ellin428]|uniref:Glycosyl hydrolase n=1 Tax=Chthoniobacter flavus Ellin428 TaxID=497964 RepID=B4CTP0_9BACT|nr:exo-alpha-sialidase [Chthoniobacter flavus]EDY21936.1 glycosyl hydrolase [Chthoniobacter flavus Ellin428]TCO89326.1 hypothetical protein EV701_11460 [Chthoniobacter flavus]
MPKLYFAIEDALVVLTTNGDDAQCELQLTGHDVQCVAVDPLRPQHVYCGTFGSGLWHSDDAGQSWRPAGEGIAESKVQSVAISTLERVDDNGVIYAGTEPSAIYRSENVGKSWQPCPDLTALPSSKDWSFPPRPYTHHVRWIEPDPHVSGRIFVAIEAGALIRSPDSGAHWQDRTASSPYDTHQLLIHPAAPDRLYSAAGDGYFESYDGGNTWQPFEDGLENRYVWSVALDAGDPNTVLISSARSPRQSHYKPAESFLYRRSAGSSWQQVTTGLPDPAGRHTALLAAHPSARGTFYAAWENDVFHSTDAGLNWARLNTQWSKEIRINEICEMAINEAA